MRRLEASPLGGTSQEESPQFEYPLGLSQEQVDQLSWSAKLCLATLLVTEKKTYSQSMAEVIKAGPSADPKQRGEEIKAAMKETRDKDYIRFDKGMTAPALTLKGQGYLDEVILSVIGQPAED